MSGYDHTIRTGRRSWLKSLGLAGVGTGLPISLRAADVSQGKPVRGVVLMVSDGMSPGVLTMAEAYSKLCRNRGTRWWELLNDRKATRGLMDTASANSMVTDSAAASTAWGGGQRVNNGSINVDPNGRLLEPIAQILKRKPGVKVGLVTTATVTHATPAGFAASTPKRDAEADIAPQYLNRVDVILGGGSVFFERSGRQDDKDLRADFAKAGYQLVSHRDELLAARGETLLGTFSPGHLPYEIDRLREPNLRSSVPSLKEMAEAALSRFLSSGQRFLLQIEGARIDHAAHLNDIGGLLGDQLAFDDALARVLEMLTAHPDVLVVVTSDHGNSNPGLNGIGKSYTESTRSFARIGKLQASHEWLFQRWLAANEKTPDALRDMVKRHLDIHLKADELEAMLEMLKGHDVIEWNHQLEKPEGLLGQFVGNHTGIGWTGTTHTSDPTLVSAVGPQAERFSGMVRNTEVFGHLTDLLG